MCVRTRKKTFPLRLVAIVTCKSFVILGYVAKNESNHLAEDEQLYQVKRMIKRNRQHVVLDPLPNIKMGKIQCLLCWTLGADDNSTCGAELSY